MAESPLEIRIIKAADSKLTDFWDSFMENSQMLGKYGIADVYEKDTFNLSPAIGGIEEQFRCGDYELNKQLREECGESMALLFDQIQKSDLIERLEQMYVLLSRNKEYVKNELDNIHENLPAWTYNKTLIKVSEAEVYGKSKESIVNRIREKRAAVKSGKIDTVEEEADKEVDSEVIDRISQVEDNNDDIEDVEADKLENNVRVDGLISRIQKNIRYPQIVRETCRDTQYSEDDIDIVAMAKKEAKQCESSIREYLSSRLEEHTQEVVGTLKRIRDKLVEGIERAKEEGVRQMTRIGIEYASDVIVDDIKRIIGNRFREIGIMTILTLIMTMLKEILKNIPVA